MSEDADMPLHAHRVRDEFDIAREELAIHYQQLRQLDEHLFQYSSVFFTINAALLAFLAQLMSSDKQPLDPLVYLFIGFLGYTSAICVFLIAWKGYFSWEIQSERVAKLEQKLGYHISDWPPHSHIYKQHWPARHLSIAKIRWIFNLMLGVMWLVLILLFPKLTDVGTSPLVLCVYPILIPLLIVVPMAIAFGPRILTEMTKGRSQHE